MAESEYAGEIGGTGLQLTCILNEGAPTVTARTYGPGGTYETGHTWASELRKGDVVTIDASTNCTFEACRGLPCMEPVSNGDDKVSGIILTEPKHAVVPGTSAAADTLVERLAGKYYRVATVEIWAGITAVRKAHVLCIGTGAITPGSTTELDVDVSQSTTDHDLVLNDRTGTGFIPFHYVPDDSGVSYSCLVGVHTLGTATT
jgi:hypothetical protein